MKSNFLNSFPRMILYTFILYNKSQMNFPLSSCCLENSTKEKKQNYEKIPRCSCTIKKCLKQILEKEKTILC